ncbi:MAG: MBOAT family protein [Verrucomicrobiota bacterium]
MILFISSLVLIGLISGFFLANLQHTAIRRTIGWLVLVLVNSVAHFGMIDETPLTRMFGLCCVLLGAMKALVYAEWARTQKLTFARYLVYALLWFGMDPASFLKQRSGLSWRYDVVLGIVLMIIGTLFAWIVWKMEWRHIFIMFLPLSLGFHFGALRTLKGIHRRVGFPVRTLFPNPLDTSGIGDFWSKRWNVGYSQMLQRVIGRPVDALIGQRTALMATFIASGLLHEIAITLACRSGYGLPTLYFTLHGIINLLEKSWGRPIGKIPTLLAVILPLPWLFPETFRTQVIEKCLGLFF